MTNDTQHTALELFAIALYEGGYLQGNGDEIQNLLEQHLEMEKEKLKEAWNKGEDCGLGRSNYEFENADDYYNETYGGNK